jgi:hypothetical protein
MPTYTQRFGGKNMKDRTYTKWEWFKAYAAFALLSPVFLFLWFMATFVRKLPKSITTWLYTKVVSYMDQRKQDLRIPPDESIPAYMLRWWWIPRNAYFNVYLHHVLRSDDDRALHDHPWYSFSLILQGGYNEHMIQAGGIHTRDWYQKGAMRFRPSGKYNSDPVMEQDTITISITGPVLRRWGFHHPSGGWIDAYDWDHFCEANGVKSMKMDGGSDGVISERNKR